MSKTNCKGIGTIVMPKDSRRPNSKAEASAAARERKAGHPVVDNQKQFASAVDQFVRQNPGKCFEDIRIYTHGGSGSAEMGHSTLQGQPAYVKATVNKNGLLIIKEDQAAPLFDKYYSAGDKEAQRTVIGPLKKLAKKAKRIVIAGCNTGQGKKGSKFLKTLSSMIGVPVAAPKVPQFSFIPPILLKECNANKCS